MQSGLCWWIGVIYTTFAICLCGSFTRDSIIESGNDTDLEEHKNKQNWLYIITNFQLQFI